MVWDEEKKKEKERGGPAYRDDNLKLDREERGIRARLKIPAPVLRGTGY
jgi:hypothetical protein